MLRVHRNTLYILSVFIIISIVLSAVFNCLSISSLTPCKEWFAYACNISIGVMGSSILSFILAFIGYFQERRLALERFYYQISKMVNTYSKYKQCKVSEKEKLNENLELIMPMLRDDLRELGNAYAQIAFVFDFMHNRRNYLFRMYSYFMDLNHIISQNVFALSHGLYSQDILDFLDNAILDIKTEQIGECTYTQINNRIHDDFDKELYVLVDMINRKDKLKDKFYFKKSAVNSKIFRVYPEEIERQLKVLNEKVVAQQKRRVDISETDNLNIEKLREHHFINETVSNKEKKIVAVGVTDKCYYYFELKESYLLREE